MIAPDLRAAAVRLPRVAGTALGSAGGLVVGSALGGFFGAVAVVRRGRPLHPDGVVLNAVLRRTGSPEP